MNLYQTLNQEYRTFRMKTTLKEAETPIVEDEDIETPTEEDLKQDDRNILATRLNEISSRLSEIEEALNIASDDEKEALNSERDTLQLEVDKIEKDLNGLNDSEEPTEEIAEVTEEVEEPDKESVITKISELTAISKEDLISELEKASDEEKESVKNNLNLIKDLACELFPEECGEEIEEPSEEIEEVTEEIEEPEEIKECEITNFKVVRVAPKASAFMLEAQTKDGIKYITGKNFNEETKVLDEAELTDSKQEATNRFKSLLNN